jgi:hypothetical protein
MQGRPFKMKTYTVTNRPQLEGQFAVTRPVSRSKKPSVFTTAFYKSRADAVEAKGRIGVIAKVVNQPKPKPRKTKL